MMVVVRELRIGPSSTAKTAELKTAVYDAIGEHYDSKKVAWDTVARDGRLEEVPGVQKAGYGKYEYVGDDAAREELE